jgi:F-type H+-transporting ATPase subunit epsilon
MAGELHLRVITPDKIALDTHTDALRVPAADGLMGILQRHAPMVAALDSGVLRWNEGGKPRHMFVSGGFCEVQGSQVRIVTQAGERPAEIDEARAREAEQRARERLKVGKASAGEALDTVRAELALRRALLRLSAKSLE